jgi:hypothetical protein
VAGAQQRSATTIAAWAPRRRCDVVIGSLLVRRRAAWPGWVED